MGIFKDEHNFIIIMNFNIQLFILCTYSCFLRSGTLHVYLNEVFGGIMYIDRGTEITGI
jgi:hypothetical protein